MGVDNPYQKARAKADKKAAKIKPKAGKGKVGTPGRYAGEKTYTGPSTTAKPTAEQTRMANKKEAMDSGDYGGRRAHNGNTSPSSYKNGGATRETLLNKFATGGNNPKVKVVKSTDNRRGNVSNPKVKVVKQRATRLKGNK